MAALFLPEGVARQLVVEGGEPVDRLHLTLAFVTEDATTLTRRQVTGALRALAATAAGTQPLEGQIIGWGRFHAEQDAIWAHADLPALPEFRQAVVEALESAGMPPRKDHGFTPHITLAYVEPAAPSPVDRIGPITVRFDTLTLALGGTRHELPMGGRVAKAAGERALSAALKKAFQDLKAGVPIGEVADHLSSGDLVKVMNLLASRSIAPHVGGIQEALRMALRGAGGAEAAALGFSFDMVNPRVFRWIAEHTGDLITAIDDTTREAVRQVITRAYASGIPPLEAAGLIRQVVGLHPRWANAVANYHAGLLANPAISPATVSGLVQAYADRLLSKRALMIARTETMFAANQGRLASWAQAASKGLIDPATSFKEWTVGPGACDLCAPMSGRRVPLDGMFGDVGAPPLHPHCRCTVVLVGGTPEDLAQQATIAQGLAEQNARLLEQMGVQAVPPGVPQTLTPGARGPAAPAFRDLPEAQQRWVRQLAESQKWPSPEDLHAKLASIAKQVDRNLGGLMDDIDRVGADILAKAKAAEGPTTDFIKKLAHDLGGTDPIGLEFRLKTEDSIRSKLIRELLEKVQLTSVDAAGAGMRDVLRYTLAFPDDAYSLAVRASVERFQNGQYQVSRFLNSWDNPYYRGLNANFSTPNGYVFELQFHTPASYKLKVAEGPNSLHSLYERWRVLDAASPEAERLKDLMGQLSAGTKVPGGAESLVWDQMSDRVLATIPDNAWTRFLRDTAGKWPQEVLDTEDAFKVPYSYREARRLLGKTDVPMPPRFESVDEGRRWILENLMPTTVRGRPLADLSPDEFATLLKAKLKIPKTTDLDLVRTMAEHLSTRFSQLNGIEHMSELRISLLDWTKRSRYWAATHPTLQSPSLMLHTHTRRVEFWRELLQQSRPQEDLLPGFPKPVFSKPVPTHVAKAVAGGPDGDPIAMFRSVLDHELGHMAETHMPSDWYWEYKSALEAAHDGGWRAGHLSWYSTTSRKELFAELFATHAGGRGDLLPSGIRSFFEAHFSAVR